METLTATPPAVAPPELREPRWAHALARKLFTRGVTPNALSIASVTCSALAAAFLPVGTLVHSGVGTAALLLAAVCLQLRLLCNRVDGILVTEGGLATRAGDVFDDLLDRCADTIILVAAGYAVASTAVGPLLGWTAAMLAIMTEYVRFLESEIPPPQDTHALMTKKHRMACLTGACVLAALLPAGWSQALVLLALAIITLGCATTLWFKVPQLFRDADAR